MAEDLIGYRGLLEKAYETLAPTAFRLVARDAIAKAAKTGLPGAHHFFITFRTRAEGVDIGDRLVEQFPDEMTIVIQHQYWDLEAHREHFSVILRFGGVPQQLIVPYSAITRFVDPEANAVFSMEEIDAPDEAVPARAAKPARGPAKPAKAGKTAEPAPAAPAAADATVVQLDAFRRK